MKPKISVVIPARNEAHYLPRCLDRIDASASRLGHPVERIVVINRCTDATEEIARSRDCRIVHEDAKNLARIRNAGIFAAEGELLVTIDADSRMSPRMLTQIEEKLSRADIVGGGVMMWPERWSLGIALTMLCLTPYVLEGLAGGVFFLRREDALAVGGFNEKLASVEDIDFARRVKALGKSRKQRFVMLQRSWIVTSCRKFDHFGDWYFIKHPKLFRELLRGSDQEAANLVWYDFDKRD